MNDNVNIFDQYFGKTCSIIWFFTKNSIEKDICSNPITHLRSNDFICLPDRSEVLQVWKWAKSIFNYSDDQRIIYKDLGTNETENEKRIFLREILKKFSGDNVVIFTFNTDYVLNEEASKFNIKVCNDDIYRLPDKRWIHPTIPGSEYSSDIFKEKFPNDLIKMNKGYTCYSIEELSKAKTLLDPNKIKIIKNVFSSAGRNIFSFQNDKEFELILKELKFDKIKSRNYDPAYIIEEAIGDGDVKRECKTPIVHYIGKTVCPGVFHQNVKSFRYLGMSSIKPNKKIADKCIEIGNILSQTLNLYGPWGIDFVVDENEYPYPIDINVGRMCGSHYFRFFLSLHAPGKEFYCWKVGNISLSISEFQKDIESKKIQFDFVKKKGVMPIKVLDHGNFTIIIVGDSQEEILEIKKILDIESFI